MGSVAYIPPEGKDYKWYIKGLQKVFLANSVVTYHRSHLLREPEKAIEYTSHGRASWSNQASKRHGDVVFVGDKLRDPYRWGDILREGRPVYLYTFADYILHPIYINI